MRYGLLMAMLALGCGAAKGDEPADSPACAGNTIDGCGDTCQVCESTDERAVPTCVNEQCGTACADGTCSDQSCAKLNWEFSSGTLEGVTPRLPAGLQLAVRNHLGSQALAVDVTSLTEISFRLPICITGTATLSNRPFAMDVFFEGGDPNGEQYFTQVSVPSPQGTFVGQSGVQAGTTFHFTGTIPVGEDTQTATEVTIQAGSFGAAFAGTIWFDNITLQ